MDNAVRMTVEVYGDEKELSARAAARIVELIGATPADSTFCIALAGGNTPLATYTLLGSTYRTEVAWERVHLFWGDERYVPQDSAQSNYFAVRESLLAALPIPPENIHPVNTGMDDAEDAARAYQKVLGNFFPGSLPKFDLVILGMGEDGHTASLFPHSTALLERSQQVVVTQAPTEPSIRVSFTFPLLEEARTTLVLVSGEKKREVLREVLDSPEQAREKYPIAMLAPKGEFIWMVDRAAFGEGELKLEP